MPQLPPITLPANGFNEMAMCRHGPMLFNRHDRYIGASLRKYGEYSRGESELFRQIVIAGATVVEAGANIGVHTVELSQLVGPQGSVLAYEPQRIVFQTLCANLALNSCANVQAFQLAIGAEPGEILVPSPAPDQPNNFGGLSLIGVTTGDSVRLVTIDQIGLEHCDVLKLDLEGMEVEALKGGANTIAVKRPIIYAENDRRERSEELLSLLHSWNYRVYSHSPPLYSPDNFAGEPENIFETLASVNVLGLPAERDIAVVGMPEISSP